MAIGTHNAPAAAEPVVDSLAGQARERTGLSDLGGDSWRDGLTILVDALESTPNVMPTGRDELYGQFTDALSNRLRVIDYLNRHPDIACQRINQPIVILGLPRTGTTLASYLLDTDPARRSLLNWEAGDSVPPPATESLRTDPRCLAKKAALDELAAVLEKARFPIPHWEDADGPTECSSVHIQDFKALQWEAYMPTSRYSDWYLEADMTSTYEYERLVLQLLQSQAPGTWSLKMPSHSVHIDALLAAFPDARIIWAHRDPFKATASTLSMHKLSRSRILGPDFDIATAVPFLIRQLRAHVERPLRARERIGDEKFFHLHYAALMRDPVGQMRLLYEWAGDPLLPEVEQAMRSWLERHPQDRFGLRRYSLEEFGVTKADLAPVYDEYLSAFDIEREES